MAKLSILIPTRNEQFLQKTIDDIKEHIEGDTEILVALDNWVNPSDIVADKVIYTNKGQRGATNELARLSTSKYLMKVDAHCSFSQGFDVAMMNDMEDDVTLVPVLLNLRPYEWKCDNGHRFYQNKKPEHCNQCELPVEMDIIWQTIPKPVTSSFVFNSNMIFEYAKEQSKEVLSETMCIQGSGWMVTRDKYWELDLSGEDFGSWGQQGVEISCKTWLSGGRVLNTKNAYMSHWFRQEDEFPYQRDMEQVKHAFEHSKELFVNGKWLKAIHNLEWLVKKFDYPSDWKEKLCIDK